MIPRIIPLALVGLVAACATSPLGRSQLTLFPEAEMEKMGVAAYDKIKQESPQSTDAAVNRYVRCVADAISAEVRGGQAWEVTVFRDDTANAFALPGGKIGVHTGLLEVARNQDQLATVIGHEVAHVLANHSNERVSTAYATQTGLQIVEALGGSASPMQRQLLGLLGAGAQVGIVLPYGRAQESEADLLGLDLMAKAGFDPSESVELWVNMSKAGGPQPPEFLSTHPANQTRIDALRQRVPHAQELQTQARAQRPNCS